jgi:hypothetical protein
MKGPFQFRLRTLLIVMALIACWLGAEMLANRGKFWASGGGVLIDVGDDSPSYIGKARGALDAWLKAKNYSQTEQWPELFVRKSRPGDACYVSNASGPTMAYVLISASNSSLSAEEGVSTVTRGPFDNGAAAVAVLKELFGSLQGWGKQYLAANPAPAAERETRVNSAE